MILSGHQPNFMPWIGYFHKVSISDKHIFVDNVQYNKKHVTNRNKIKTPNGWEYLTVPVLTKGRYEQEIKDALSVPEHIAVVAYTPIGYPDENPVMRDKKPLSEIVHYEKW